MIVRSFMLGTSALALVACAEEKPLPTVDYVQMSELPEVRKISVIDLAARIETGDAVLVDLRPSAEFGAARIAGALNAPLSHFDPATIPNDERREIVLYAGSDTQSGAAAQRLAEQFGGAVRHLEGGSRRGSMRGKRRFPIEL